MSTVIDSKMEQIFALYGEEAYHLFFPQCPNPKECSIYPVFKKEDVFTLCCDKKDSGRKILKETPYFGEVIRYFFQKRIFYQSLKCGTRFTLPERDEIGRPALLWEVRASLKSASGVYFDDEAGHFCRVDNIPLNLARRAHSLFREK